MKEIMSHLQGILEEFLRSKIPFEIDSAWWNAQSDGITVNGVWREEWKHSIQNLVEPMNELLLRGGKRWRPLSMMLTGLSLGLKMDDILILASLVEIPHNASLIVDDIEDSSPLRRGKPAMHVLFGEDNAINSANFAYFLPLTELDKLEVDLNIHLKLYQAWHLGMRRVHLGQAIDITWHNSDIIPTKEEYETMAQLKTGALVAMGMDLLAVLAGKTEQERRTIQSAWLKIGLGFQVLDDAFNLSHGIKGKSKADDIVEGKKSLPVILYCEEFPSETMRLTELLNQAKNDLTKAEQVATLLVDSGVVHQTYLYGQLLLEQAMTQIRSLLPDDAYREILLTMIRDFEVQMRA
ncbi:polyprenyl synthetase family protein [Entomospira entomophila]|uniref:Polyprenyl synthetase family protein n=1 Tax=Entomospira entomophila TaxID=2719988 RepID=A0A968G9D4_9SPIO|nr:polyprenyl synthetase family protein [Entomospira entomophilus]NIZ40985.1 polyprenyl synthetase family protein [Entomospira entomophilus]WDI35198.1 polyprenyl synthetase family protein [Entomospira entomophilus]